MGRSMCNVKLIEIVYADARHFLAKRDRNHISTLICVLSDVASLFVEFWGTILVVVCVVVVVTV